ncbi:MAG: RAMP superfamily CRISPR-associated protein [Acidobacteria bacterium]|nr:RAMP superfamily CRISPR-associated protein [Acidobacteriota bacterium]
MTNTLTLRFELKTPATFGRGGGLAGYVDQEVEHDQYGLPFLRGRALRGLLAEEMESLLFTLGVVRAKPQTDPQKQKWKEAADRLLGVSGEINESGILHVGDARLSDGLWRLLAWSVEQRRNSRVGDPRVHSASVLAALTAIRRQTAMTERGAPEPASLRSLRVVLPGLPFESLLTFDQAPEEEDLALLAATTLAWRRVGVSRNRGRGNVQAVLESPAKTRQYFETFQREVLGE